MDGITFCSPPKVRRLVCLTENLEVVESPSSTSVEKPVNQGNPGGENEDSKAAVENSVSLESALVDQAVDNLLTLPEVVGQVSVIQKDHHLEVQKHLVQLTKLEGDIKQSKEKYNCVMREMSSIDRKTRMVEETVQEKEKLCLNYQKEIEALVSTSENLRHRIRLKQAEFHSQKSQYEAYQSKMDAHKTKVHVFERTLPFRHRLLNLQQSIETLKMKKEQLCGQGDEYAAVCSGCREQQLKTDIDSVKNNIITVNEEMTCKQKQLSDLKSQGDKIELAITVLHKRNAAQLTRLKRQVREQQLRHRQWKDQHEQIEHSITQVKKKLEEFQT